VIFTTADEVELTFKITLTGNQWLGIENYIRHGVRPDAGCSWCDTGFIRELTGRMDAYDGPTPYV
jgi:hypothetical protein